MSANTKSRHNRDPVIESPSLRCMKCYGLASPATFYCKLHDAALCAGCCEDQWANDVFDSLRCILCELKSSKGDTVTTFRPVGRFPTSIVEAKDEPPIDDVNVFAYMSNEDGMSGADQGDVAQAIVDESDFQTVYWLLGGPSRQLIFL